MKKFSLKFIIIVIVILGSQFLSAQPGGPPPPPGGPHGGEQDVPAGGDAPLGSSLGLLLGLSTAYGVRKVYLYNKQAKQ